MALQRGHGGQRVARAFQQAASGDVAEIVRGQIGQQRQPHIGGRSPVRDDGAVIILKIIRRQPVIFGGHELFEKSPGPARVFSEKNELRGAQARLARRQRAADPPGDGRRTQPQQQDGRRDRQCGGRQRGAAHRAGHGDEWPAPHTAQCTGQIVAPVAFHFAGCVPFQQSPVRDTHARERAQNRVQTETGFKRQAGEPQQRLCKTVSRGLRHRGQMLP